LGCIVGDEADILQKFWSFFSKRETCVVTWNGRGFDLPVLLHRSLIHKINAGGWFQSADRYGGYQYRYSADRHCDLMDQMSDYGASTKVGLDMVAKALGLPGKQEVTGADVADLYAAGRLQDIAAYCETDVLNLYGVYLRWCLMTGRLTEVDHDAAVDDLAEFLSRDGIPHRITFKGQCSTSFLNSLPQPSAAIGVE
jgi:predicted PolB exonuclease-like 3'-5' exonuclease